MPSNDLPSRAEKHAAEAEGLDAFDGLKLAHIRGQVAEILSLIGRSDIFDEYTMHDISHVDGLLESLDWLIPAQTQEQMTPAEWLLIVLAIYLHDLGLLVTKDEFEKRGSTGFPAFCERVYADDAGADYRAKVEQLRPELQERFLYQEFVREHHAARIRSWITGAPNPQLGMSRAVTAEVSSLLASLSEPFRRDLALVCESHHLDDLDDFDKYRVSQPYGKTAAETPMFITRRSSFEPATYFTSPLIAPPQCSSG